MMDAGDDNDNDDDDDDGDDDDNDEDDEDGSDIWKLETASEAEEIPQRLQCGILSTDRFNY